MISFGGKTISFNAILDTGFEGQLMLPSETIRDAGLPYYDDYEVYLADGQVSQLHGYEGIIIWHGREREVLVLESEDQALLGMNLLWRNRIIVEAYANGPVTIEELG